jgi:hypothetical protein
MALRGWSLWSLDRSLRRFFVGINGLSGTRVGVLTGLANGNGTGTDLGTCTIIGAGIGAAGAGTGTVNGSDKGACGDGGSKMKGALGGDSIGVNCGAIIGDFVGVYTEISFGICTGNGGATGNGATETGAAGSGSTSPG